MWPDFTRVAWASAEAQSVWSARIRRVSQAWEQIERLSVLDGIRASALQSVAPDALPHVSREMASVGLQVVVLERTGASASYSASRVPLQDGQPWTYRVAMATPAAALRWPTAWADSDDAAIGRMLGFPDCCRRFFARTWGAGMVDTTGAMDADVMAYPECNILLRWLGVRAVTHLPCSFACEPSARLGRAFLDCGRRAGLTDAMDWLEEMLDWPVEWSALHGIAEIVTPVCRIQTRTEPTATRQVIRRNGSRYPAEGARGIWFPFRRDVPAPHPIALEPRTWTDNGFSSREAMDAAHAELLAAIGPGPFRCVVDLGCGTGALLRQVPAARRVGVESDTRKASRARAVLDAVWTGDCTSAEAVALLARERPDLVIAQAHRNPPETLPGYRVLTYSYDAPRFARLRHVSDEVTA